MSINTTVKVGFDGTEVKSGLKNIGGMFNKFNKEVGIGAVRKIGELGTDLLGKALSFFAETPGLFLDYAGDLKDLSTLTGESIENLQLLQETFRLAGVESMDTGKSILLLSKSIAQAKDEALSGGEGPMVEIFDKLKLGIGDLMKMKPAAQIETIFAAMNANVPEFGEQIKIMQALFGKGGLKMLQVFRDNFAGTMEKSKSNLASLAKISQEEIDGLESLGDELGRLPIMKMRIFRNLLNGIFGENTGATTAENLGKFYDAIGDGGEVIYKLGKQMREFFDYVGKNGFGQVWKDIKNGFGKLLEDIKKGIISFASDIGTKIGTAFSKAVEDYFKGTKVGSMMSKSTTQQQPSGSTMTRSMTQQQPAGSSQSNSEGNTNYLQKVVDILQLIYRKDGGAVFQ